MAGLLLAHHFLLGVYGVHLKLTWLLYSVCAGLWAGGDGDQHEPQQGEGGARDPQGRPLHRLQGRGPDERESPHPSLLTTTLFLSQQLCVLCISCTLTKFLRLPHSFPLTTTLFISWLLCSCVALILFECKAAFLPSWRSHCLVLPCTLSWVPLLLAAHFTKQYF